MTHTEASWFSIRHERGYGFISTSDVERARNNTYWDPEWAADIMYAHRFQNLSEATLFLTRYLSSFDVQVVTVSVEWSSP